MVEEVATIILELHQGGGGHANTACCQHQAEATTSDREKDEEQGQDNKKRGEGSRCEDPTILYILCLASFSVVCLNPKPICSYRIHQTEVTNV